jgi:Alginate export
LRRDPTGRSTNDVGEELDLLTNFHLTTHTDLLFGYSHLYAGDFIKRTGNGRSPDFFYAQYSYRW